MLELFDGSSARTAMAAILTPVFACAAHLFLCACTVVLFSVTLSFEDISSQGAADQRAFGIVVAFVCVL